MISVSEAKSLIQQHCFSPKTVELSIVDATGFILSEPVFSLVDTPPFDQSAMDGYAFSFADWDEKSQLQLVGEIQAGSSFSRKLQALQAVRIFTGAAVPNGADTVVMQEKTIPNEHSVLITDTLIAKGANVRPKGSQTQKGAMVLDTGHRINPASVSLLASVGIHKVKVYANPTVSILVTGKELVKPGNEIAEGMIYESNSYGLHAALKQLNIAPVSVDSVDDDKDLIAKAISKELTSDILIITGGVSVGDYDYVASALENCGVEKVFHKVKQKPGKPFYFGIKNNTLVFALPGNPAAVMTCFYEYVLPAIQSFTKINYFKKTALLLANSYKKKAGLTHFVKGKTNGPSVEILNSQESYLMNSFAHADCIVELPEDSELFKAGDILNVNMIAF